ncbi:MAG: hypothetical protein ACYS17_12715 [Planctomycetota bacterium]
MELRRGIIVILVITAITTVTILPCFSQEKKTEEDIWAKDEPRGPGGGPGRGGPGGGPGRGGRGGGPVRGGRGHGRFELTEDEINRILKNLQISNPTKVKELKELREKDPNQFSLELRRHGREEYGKIIRERIEKWRKERQNEFIEWLKKAAPKESRDLAKLNKTNPNLYTDKFEDVWRKYERIFEEGRRNPELSNVLLEDLKLKKTREGLVKKIKASRDERQKKLLAAELEEVVARRFDLIVRRKQIEYERLLRWLKELQDRITERKKEMNIWMDEEYKDVNVKKRMQDLFEETSGFSWD